MNLFLSSPAVRATGWALMHFIWQGTLLAALFAATCALTKPSQAKLRYALACVTMLLMPAIFLATAVRTALPRHTLDLPESAAVSRAAAVGSGQLPATVPGFSEKIHTQYPEERDLLAGWAVFLWLTGIAALSINTFAGWLRAQRLARRGAGPVNPALVRMMESLQRRMGISRPVRLRMPALAEVPAVIGWLRPYILLPVSAITGLNGAELEAILAHELAHIRRHDYLVNLLQNAVETLLFYHPAVWWIGRRIREEREHCCDDIAVAVCGDAMSYAGALAQLEELRHSIGEPALAATGGDLLGRIRRLAGTGDRRPPRIPGAIGSLGAAAIVAIVAVSFSAIRAQSPARPPAFEVASVKPNDPNAPASRMAGVRTYPGGRVVIVRMSLRALVAAAFRIPYWQISGGEAWTEKENYDIEARPALDLKPPITNLRHTWWGLDDERLCGMLQALLVDRFHLQFHRETKTGKVYFLEQSGKRLRLRQTDPDFSGGIATTDPGHSGDIGFSRRAVIYNTSMKQLADFASGYVLHAPVLDKTGLAGWFDYKTATEMTDDEIRQTPFESRFLSLIPELGLKLTARTGPVETFVVDHAERPSGN